MCCVKRVDPVMITERNSKVTVRSFIIISTEKIISCDPSMREFEKHPHNIGRPFFIFK